MKLEDYDSRHLLFAALFMTSNRLQSIGDRFNEEITSKQWFLLAALNTFEYAPTFNELSSLMGSSHQNVKQIALKLQQTRMTAAKAGCALAEKPNHCSLRMP